jgi:hypothetical protein
VLRELPAHRAELLLHVDREVCEDGERCAAVGVGEEDGDESEGERLEAAGEGGGGAEAAEVGRLPAAGRGLELRTATTQTSNSRALVPGIPEL